MDGNHDFDQAAANGSERRAPWRVALAGYYGFGNLGDELLAEAAIASLLRCGLDRSDIVLLSAAPEESRKKFGVESINRWKISEVCRTLRRSKTLLMGGGGLFQDSTSLRSCLYYWWLVRAARFFGAVTWALGQSVGPLRTSAGRALTRDALSLCRVLQVRDAASESLCASLGIAAERGEDLIFSLSESLSKSFTKQIEAPSSATLLVNLRPHVMAESFADAISAFAASAYTTSSFSGGIVGVAMAEEDERLLERLSNEGRLPLSRIERIRALEDAARVLRGTVADRAVADGAAANRTVADGAVAVGMRLHFVILAAIAGIPLAAASYDPKVESFAAARGVPVWRGGAIPAPLAATLPIDFSPRVCYDIDVLCHKVLHC